MSTYHSTQQSLTIALLLSFLLQSCMAVLKLAHHPLNRILKNAQETLPSAAHAANLQPRPISAYTFNASCGQLINFFQETGLWKARVQDSEGVSRVLPVVCAPQKQLLPMIARLAQQGANLQKHHIHVLNNSQNQQAQYVFVGDLTLKGGMLKSGYTSSALCKAIINGDLELVKTLLVIGADPNRADESRFTPLQLAAIKVDLEMITLLLERGANPTIAHESGLTLLPWAAENGHLKLVNFLLEKFPQLHAAEANDLPALNLAIERGHLEIAKLLLAKGVNPNTATANGCTPLHLTAYEGHIELVKLLLESGANPNVIAENGSTPLHLAAYGEYLDLLNLLLEKGADPTITDLEDCTPLHIAACYRSHMPIISRLILSNVDINAQDVYGDTFLHNLVDDDSLSLAEQLHRFIEAMKDIDNKHAVLLTKLTEVMQDYCPALTHNRETRSILAMMIDYIQGVDLTLKNQDKKSLLGIIENALTEKPNEQDYEEVTKILERYQKLGGWLRSRV